MSIFFRLVSVVGYLVLAVGGAAVRAFGGSSARAFRRTCYRGLLTGCVVIAVLGVGASSSLAAQTRELIGTFGSASSSTVDPFPLSDPQNVAVDQSTGDVYVADTGNHRVEKFDSSGNFVLAFGADVGGSGVNTCTSGCQPGTSGTGPGQFTTAEFVAVDPTSGDVYVADTGDNLVQRFDSLGNLITTWGDGGRSSCGTANGQLSGACATGGPFGPIAGITVDAGGNLIVFDTNSTKWVFVSNGTPSGSASLARGTAQSGVAVDSAGNFFKVNGDGSVERFDSSNNDSGTVTPDTGLVANAIAIEPASGDLFVGNAAGSIDHYAFNSSEQVIEPDGSTCAPVEFTGCGASDSTSIGFSPSGIAAVTTSGDTYVSNPSTGQVYEYGPLVTVPDVTTGSASNVTATGATLNGTVNPDSTTITDCQFVVVADAQYHPSAANPYSAGSTVGCSSTPSGSTPVPVSADVSGLTGDTVYHFRLEASNASGAVDGDDQTFTTGPVVSGVWASSVGSSDATLNAQINPEDAETTYHFEYGTSTSYGTSVPVPDADIGAGQSAVSVSQPLSGLASGTTYHYRLVTTGSVGIVDGPDHTFTTFAAPVAGGSCPNAEFRTGPSASLPDCRAWEQVSPVDKGGVDAIYRGGPNFAQRAAPGGDAFSYLTLSSFGGASGNELPSAYLATRTAGGWQTDNITPPTPDPGPTGGLLVGYDFSADLSEAVIQIPDELLAPNTPTNVENLFLRHADGGYSLITTAPPVVGGGCPPGNPQGNVCFQFHDEATFAGASSDFSHVIFESNDALTSDAPSAPLTSDGFERVHNLYESVGGRVSLVGYLPDGTPVAAQPGSGELASSDGNIGTAQDIQGAVSADGSRIFFTAIADGGQPDPAQSGLSEVYERVNGSSTVEVSAPAQGATPGNSTPEPATYWGASTDGSRVLFTSAAELTSDANTGSSNAGQDLYQYDTATGSLTDLSVDANPADSATGADVQGVVGASTDGSYVYFVATGQLVAGKGTDGRPSLYRYHGGQVSFVATLSPGDAFDWTNHRLWVQSYVTPDGRHLAFMSTAPVTGYDNTDASTGQPDSEVYEYSADDGQLVCASCDPTGARPVGNAFIGMSDNVLFLGNSVLYQPRVLSDDGSRVFFSSPDALTPGAGGTHAKVYEYEHGGVSLIGAATDGNDIFLDATPSGDDVFVATPDQLVPSDQDQLVDVYDARVDGGLPAQNAPAACQADACQGQPTSAPTLPIAASVGFIGPANAGSSTATGKVKVTRKAVHGTRFLISVKVPGPGRITITGAGVKTVRKSVSRAGTFKLRVALTAKEKRLLRRKHRLKLKLRVVYAPASGSSSSASVTVTVTGR